MSSADELLVLVQCCFVNITAQRSYSDITFTYQHIIMLHHLAVIK